MPRLLPRSTGTMTTVGVAVLAVAAALAGCTAGPGGPSPAGSARATEGTAAPLAVPNAPTPVASEPPVEAAEGCTVNERTFLPPTVRLEDVAVADLGDRDRITFEFGPGGPPSERSSIGPASPPFFAGQSTNEVDVAGDRFVKILFRDMLQEPAAGEVVFVGPHDLRPGFPALQQLVATDEFEGVMEWIVGITGDGCATLAVDEKGGFVTVDIEHGS
jgi:hypothetical protein